MNTTLSSNMKSSPSDNVTDTAFRRLKPLGAAVLNPASWSIHVRSNHPIQILLEQVKVELGRPNGRQILAPLVPFISFPLVETLKSPKTSGMTIELCLETLEFLFSQISTKNDVQIAMPPSMWTQLFSILPKYGFQADFLPPSHVNLTEEMQNHVLSILHVLLNALPSMPHSSISLHHTSLLPLVAHHVMMLLYIMENTKPNNITQQASQCLIVILREIGDPDKIVQFLPGIVSKMNTILNKAGDFKRHHSVIVDSLEVLGVLLPMVIGDDVCRQFVNDPTTTDGLREATVNTPTTTESNKSISSKFLIRSQEWFDGTVKQVSIALQAMYRSRSRDNVHVRQAFLRLSQTLLTTCTLSLQSCRELFVETICLYTNDVDVTLANSAQDVLTGLRDQNKVTRLWIADATTSLLQNQILSMRANVSGKSDSQILEQLQLTSSLMLACGNDAKAVLASNIDAVLDELMLLIEFSKDSQLITISDHNLQSSEPGQMDLASRIRNTHIDSVQDLNKLFPRKPLLHFKDDDPVKHAETLLQLVGYHCDPALIFPQLVKRLQTSANSKGDTLDLASILYITNQIILGMGGDTIPRISQNTDSKNAKEAEHWAHTIIRQYLALGVLAEPSNISSPSLLLSSSSAAEYTLRDFYRVTLTTNLVLEGLAYASTLLTTARSVSFVLMDALYPVLEKVNDSNHLIQSSAELTLASFARSYFSNSCVPIHSLLSPSASDIQEPTIRNLVLCNVDYLIDSVSQRLATVEKYPYLPSVLLAAVKITGSDLVGPLMVDTVDQLFDVLDDLGTGGYLEAIESLDNLATKYGHHLLDQILAVFQALLEAMPTPVTLKCQEPKGAIESADMINKVSLVPSHSQVSPEILAFNAKYGNKKKNVFDANGKDDGDLKSMNAKEYFEKRLREMAENPKVDQNEEDTAKEREADEPDMDEPTNVLTPYESLSLSILQKCLEFLRSDSAWIRARILRMIALGLVQLHAQSKELLPFIHNCWPAIISRCKDPEHFVILEAMNVIRVISELSKDFVRKRVSDDLFPKLAPLFSRLHQEIVKESKDYSSPVSKTSSRSLVRRELAIASGRAMALHESKIVMSSFRTLEMIMGFVPISTKDAVVFVDCLVPFLNDKIYSEAVRRSVEDILVALCHNSNIGDWIWAKLFVLLGAKLFGPADVSLSDRVSPLAVPAWMSDKKTPTPYSSPYLTAANNVFQRGFGSSLVQTENGISSGICLGLFTKAPTFSV